MATTKIIQSIERAMSILELFQDRVLELSLKEIAEALNLNKSTAFGLINSLTTLGYLLQNEENQKYSLGPKILCLSNAVKMNNVIIRIAHPHLERLAGEYMETIHSAISTGDSIIYLDKVEADSSFIINTKMGIKNYIHCTGVGKCMLAYVKEEEIDKLLKFPLPARTYNTITEKPALLKVLKRCRRQGYAMDNEEIEIGLSCIGVPVFQKVGVPGFAISISGATSRIQDKMKHTELVQALKKTAAHLAKEIYGFEE